MKHRYLVTYDISNPVRLRAVFVAMKGFGAHLQFSVFRCDLSQTRFVEMRAKLREIIDHSADQILFINLGLSEGRGREVIESLGRQYVEPDGGPLII